MRSGLFTEFPMSPLQFFSLFFCANKFILKFVLSHQLEMAICMHFLLLHTGSSGTLLK